jgi:hypothetical protein
VEVVVRAGLPPEVLVAQLLVEAVRESIALHLEKGQLKMTRKNDL